MIHTLKDYISGSLPENEWFSTRDSLRLKVSPHGKLLPYYGNTLVYLLDAQTRRMLRHLQAELYLKALPMLAEPLQEDTFHMTVHDLVNGPVADPQLRWRMEDAEQKVRQLPREVFSDKPLRMRATWMFNMVNTSIVLGLEPADRESYDALDRLYTALETVVPLGYALTPHITLAYFRPGHYAPDSVARLRSILRPVDLEIVLKPEDLVLQHFQDMNTYHTVPDNHNSHDQTTRPDPL